MTLRLTGTTTSPDAFLPLTDNRSSARFPAPNPLTRGVSATLVAMTLRPVLHGVLFDWDGTLLDSYHADSQAYLAMFREMGVNWGLAELEQHYSPDWYVVYRAAGIPGDRWDEAEQ